MAALIKKFILGSPLEGLARWLYLRLDQSPWSHYDRLTLAIMKRCLRPNSNCVDSGAPRGACVRGRGGARPKAYTVLKQ